MARALLVAGLGLLGLAASAAAWALHVRATERRPPPPPALPAAIELERRVVYLLDDLRVCKTSAPVVCSCEPAILEARR